MKGSSLNSLLIETHEVEEVNARAFREVFIERLTEAMRRRKITKVELARRMGSSRAHLDRLLNDSDAGFTIDTMVRACWAAGLVTFPEFREVSAADYKKAFPG